MKLAIAALLTTSASAFFQSKKAAPVTQAPEAVAVNGWVPDESKLAYGLPGALDPVGEFDPFKFSQGRDLNGMKKLREAELQHGRVAMLATLGMLVTEEPIEFHPLFEAYNKDIGPSIRHLDEVRAVSPTFFEFLGIFIAALELNRALQGWKAPGQGVSFGDLKEEYYPGDIGFDPLGLKPEDPEEFELIATKEIQNGRLAMLGAAGIIVQELINGKEIFVNLGLAEDRFDPSSVPIQF
jgi:light-harvesting complex I chlorophyll a/b binding protein 1